MLKDGRMLILTLVGIAVMTASGCGVVHENHVPTATLQNQAADFQLNPKLNLSADLCLTEEFRSTKWEITSMGEKWRISLGDSLVNCATELASYLFTKSQVTSAPIGNDAAGIDVILTPRVTDVSRLESGRASTLSRLVVVVEWRLEDAKGKLVWLQSITGEGVAPVGNTISAGKYEGQQVDLLMKDLFKKTFEAIKTSPEIQQFAASKR